jgi:hypothetical protein
MNLPKALRGDGPKDAAKRRAWEQARRGWCECAGITVEQFRAIEKAGPVTIMPVPVALMRTPSRASSLPAWEQARRIFAAEKGITIQELDAMSTEWRSRDDGTFVEGR